MKESLKAGFEEYRRKCAEIEGWKASGDKDCPWVSDAGQVLHKSDTFPTYDNDADIDRVLRLLSDEQLEEYLLSLTEVIGEAHEPIDKATHEVDIDLIIALAMARATESQKMEALYHTLRIKVGE